MARLFLLPKTENRKPYFELGRRAEPGWALKKKYEVAAPVPFNA
jgi:hypothetical protein